MKRPYAKDSKYRHDRSYRRVVPTPYFRCYLWRVDGWRGLVIDFTRPSETTYIVCRTRKQAIARAKQIICTSVRHDPCQTFRATRLILL